MQKRSADASGGRQLLPLCAFVTQHRLQQLLGLRHLHQSCEYSATAIQLLSA